MLLVDSMLLIYINKHYSNITRDQFLFSFLLVNILPAGKATSPERMYENC